MKRSTAVAIMILAGMISSYGQVPYFQNYFLLKKNEPVHVNAIFQDKTGFMWYGTNRGLFRFDGVRYQHYDKTSGLSDEAITALAQDSLQRIWIGHKNGSLQYIEKNVVKKFEAPEGQASQEISKILFDKKGNLWFATLNDGLYYYRHERMYRIDETNGMPDLFIYDIAEDKDGNIWAGTDGGVAICTLRDTISVHVLNYQSGLPDNIIKKIRVNDDGKVWMATDNSGVITYDPVQKKYTPLSKSGWPYGVISDFLIDGDKIWIASAPTGLVVFDTRTQKSKVYPATEIPALTAINALLKDQEGNVWTGSRTGIARTWSDYVEFITTPGTSGLENVHAIAVDGAGDIWFSTKDGLYRRRIKSSGEAVTEKQFQHTPYEHYTITSLFIDRDGYLWAGFYGEGALRLDLGTGRVRLLRSELRNGNVLNISGKGNTVWLATLEGATQITIAGDELAVHNYSSREGLSSDYIYQIFIDSRDRTWFATDGKGLDMRDASGFHHYDQGLNSKIVYGMAEDAQHTIWINVAGEGLYSFNGTSFKALDASPGLRDNSISCLSADEEGNLVVIHDDGIDLVDVKKNKVRYLGDEVGLREKLPNLNAVAKDKDGRLYFGTDDGIVMYADLSRHRAIPIPQPLIDGVKVLDQNVDFSGPVTLTHNKNYITINYLGVWYQNPEELYFQTKLENYDMGWIPRRDHSVTYSSLSPGEYTFKLRVSDTADFTDAKEVSLRFIISPPFWKTIWFYLLVIASVVLTGYSILKYRERKLLEDKRLLEQKVRERTLEIQRKTEEIQAQNEEIHSQAEEIRGINENLELLVKERTLELIKKNKALEEYAFITAHNLRAPVASVLGLINLICKIEMDADSEIVTHLRTSAERLDDIVRSITEAIEKGE